MTEPSSPAAPEVPVAPEAIDYVERLHAVVDELAAATAARHGDRLRCRRGCSGWCSDELTVFEVEAAVIRRHHARLLAEEAPGPAGACAFLDAAGGCRVYAHRPYVCRTQGLPLRWLEEEAGPEGVEVYEARDVCPLNLEGGPGLEALEAADCWTIGPFEQRLAALQQQVQGGGDEGRRVALRALFARN